MKVDKAKFKRLLKDGHTTFFANKVKNGYFWKLHMDNIQTFNHTINLLSKEIRRHNHGTTREMIYMLKQIQEQKSIVWMEGSLGWTAWVDTSEDVLH